LWTFDQTIARLRATSFWVRENQRHTSSASEPGGAQPLADFPRWCERQRGQAPMLFAQLVEPRTTRWQSGQRGEERQIKVDVFTISTMFTAS